MAEGIPLSAALEACVHVVGRAWDKLQEMHDLQKDRETLLDYLRKVCTGTNLNGHMSCWIQGAAWPADQAAALAPDDACVHAAAGWVPQVQEFLKDAKTKEAVNSSGPTELIGKRLQVHARELWAGAYWQLYSCVSQDYSGQCWAMRRG
jgi:hypothetical protein